MTLGLQSGMYWQLHYSVVSMSQVWNKVNLCSCCHLAVLCVFWSFVHFKNMKGWCLLYPGVELEEFGLKPVDVYGNERCVHFSLQIKPLCIVFFQRKTSAHHLRLICFQLNVVFLRAKQFCSVFQTRFWAVFSCLPEEVLMGSIFSVF